VEENPLGPRVVGLSVWQDKAVEGWGEKLWDGAAGVADRRESGILDLDLDLGTGMDKRGMSNRFGSWTVVYIGKMNIYCEPSPLSER
jgi:hypothetical protein